MMAISRNNIDFNNDNIIYDNRRNNQIRLSDRERARDDHEIANNIVLTAINCKITILYYNNKACVVLAEREESEDKIQSQWPVPRRARRQRQRHQVILLYGQ